MRLAFLGTSDFAVPALAALATAGHEIVAVYTRAPKPAGRGQQERRTPVHERAAALGIEVRTPPNLRAPDFAAAFKALDLDAAVVAAYGHILPKAFLEAPVLGCINIHGSLLPRWRGAAPIHRALLAGDEETGVCVIDVVDRMDAGPVLAVRRTRTAGKSAGALLDELGEAGSQLLLGVLDSLARGDVQRAPQDERLATRARKLQADDGRIRWEHEARAVDARVRAVTPRPGAFTQLPDGTRLSVLSGEPASCERGHLPGEVLDRDDGVVVACGKDAFRVTRLQREGKRPLDAAAFRRGMPLTPGTRFGP